MNESEDQFEEDVQVLETFQTGEKYTGEPTGQVLHERGIPLALRVRSGGMDESTINLEGASLDGADIEYISLGVVRHTLGNLDPPKGMMRQMVGKMMGKNDRSEDKVGPRHQESTYLDIYSNKHDAPFRLEAANINYRSFLGKDAQYISQHNFYRLLVRIARLAKNSRLNENAYYYILRRRDQVRGHTAIYDYELESQNDLGRLESLHATTEIDLSRDSYTLEEEGSEIE